MTPDERERLLSSWIKPSSLSEQDRQERAERMVRKAIDAHPAFAGTSIRVYAKGSYPNGTNVRLDSDVDVVVENRDCCYYDCLSGSGRPAGLADYTGHWTPQSWRQEVTNAIVASFGAGEVDTSGSVALAIAEKPGSRPSADVVPSFLYYQYNRPEDRSPHQGTKVFKAGGGHIVNWPDQQFVQGRAKNVSTGQRYKNYVRALKNAENHLVSQAAITAKPSYLMECLVWNVPDATLKTGTLDNGFRATLVWLWAHLNDQYVYEDWEEPNRLKYLFAGGQKWSLADARDVVLQTWGLLGYSGE